MSFQGHIIHSLTAPRRCRHSFRAEKTGLLVIVHVTRENRPWLSSIYVPSSRRSQGIESFTPQTGPSQTALLETVETTLSPPPQRPGWPVITAQRPRPWPCHWLARCSTPRPGSQDPWRGAATSRDQASSGRAKRGEAHVGGRMGRSQKTPSQPPTIDRKRGSYRTWIMESYGIKIRGGRTLRTGPPFVTPVMRSIKRPAASGVWLFFM